MIPGVLGDIVYRRVGALELSLDAYVQKNGDRRPAVIVVHGGGWTSGSRIARVGQILEMLTRGGFNWFSIDYRLAPDHKYPAALADLRAAHDYIRCRAREFRIDPDRIALVGEDAGAHLAALFAAERPPGVKALVCLGGIYDLRSLPRFSGEDAGSALAGIFGLAGPGTAAERVLARASPVMKVAGGMPAVLAAHGTADSEVPPGQAVAYCEAIRRAGGECEVVLEEDAIHAVENWRPEQWGYKDRVVDWLSRHLDLREPDHSPYGGRHRKDVVYGTCEDVSGSKVHLLLDAWVPDGEGPFAAVIVAHGGGWEAGDKVTYLTPVLEPLSRAGFAWFSIDYRLTPRYRHPQQLEDLRRAVRYVRHHASHSRVDPDRLALLGESASGQMVVQVAAEPCAGLAASDDPVDREPCAVQAVVSFYGVYDFLPLVKDASPRSLLVRLFGLRSLDNRARAVLRRYSPLYHVHREMPPLLLIHGTDERLWKQAVALKEKLEEVGARHHLYAIDGAPHGMENWEGHPEWMGYKLQLVNWLRFQLRLKLRTGEN